MNPKKNVKALTIEAADQAGLLRMEILSALESQGPVLSKKLEKVSGKTSEEVKAFVDAGFDAKMLQYSVDNKLEFRTAPVKLLGVSIKGDFVGLQVVNPKGGIIQEEKIKTLHMNSYKGTKVDTNKIANDIKDKTKLAKTDFTACGFAIPYPEDKWTRDTIGLMASFLNKTFKCPTYYTREAVACGYAQKVAEGMDLGRDVLYIHSDMGDSVIFKGGFIYESTAGNDGMNAYLRGWKQFGLVDTAKELIDRGVGTDMIGMVGGDLEKLDVTILFRAARAGDELAMDLVKRSALALGVRIAYLVNIFDVQAVLFPHLLSSDGGLFTRYVKESSKKFFLNERKGSLDIVPGALDNMCASYGAALLCRRQLILEV